MARKKKKKKALPPSWRTLSSLKEGDCFQMFLDRKYPEDGVKDAVFAMTSHGEVLTPGNVRLRIGTGDQGSLVKQVDCRRRWRR